MFVPGEFIALLTFPGIIVHEAAHQLCCRLFRVAVLDVCYFRMGNPAGYVQHEKIERPAPQVWVAVAPFLLNTVLGAAIAAPAAIPVLQLEAGDWLDYFLIWLGVSIAMHAFPSPDDAEIMFSAVEGSKANWLTKLFTIPIALLSLAAHVAKFFWVDMLYGIGVALLLPRLLIWILA